MFYQWDGKSWPAVEDAVLRSRIYRWFERRWYVDETTKKPIKRAFAPTMRKAADLLDALKAVTIVPTPTPTPSWFGAGDLPADELIACENGLIHWPTRTLRAQSPRFYVHHAVPFAFDPTAAAPSRWTRFLDELWGKDKESIECLQEMFGYLVSGDTTQQKMFMLVGPKRGGKGTIGRVPDAASGAPQHRRSDLIQFGLELRLAGPDREAGGDHLRCPAWLKVGPLAYH